MPGGDVGHWLMRAFADLATCRPPDGPIPWTAARLYAEAQGLDVDVFHLVWGVVRTLDATERKWQADEFKRTTGTG